MSTRTQSHTINANGLDIYYQEIGQGQPLLLLHGGTATSSSWNDIWPALSKHFRVIMPDTRGHGRTPNPSGELSSYRILADDVAAFVQALNLDTPFICGYSDGGQIALDIGIHHPNLAKGLILGGTTYRFTETYYAMLKEWGFDAPGVLNMANVETNMADALDYWRTEHTPLGGPDYWKTLLEQISTLWLTPLGYTDDDLRGITTPTLIISGDRDEGVSVEQAVEMYRLIPESELAIFPYGTHGTTISGTELTGSRFADTVIDYCLRQLTPTETPAH